MTPTITICGAIESLLRDPLPIRMTAYDGSATGSGDSAYSLHLANERGLRYIVTAPGDLGFARAYVSGDLEINGATGGDPYEPLSLILKHTRFKRPSPGEVLTLLRGLGLDKLKVPPIPPQEHLPRWRRVVEGFRHSRGRDAEAIHHHYDVSNRFYEMVLGPSMTYTCAVFPTQEASLEDAQFAKYDLICRKLGLKPGDKLLDVGCGWGGMVRHAAKHYGVRALGVTLSLEQSQWAKEAIDREGLADLAEVRHCDYRDVVDSDFDAVSSIGLTEHIGVKNYPAYFGHLRDRLKPGGRLLNHCITRDNNNQRATAGQFIDRYVFPDGELIGSGTIVAAIQDTGLEVQHEENLRQHYALTLKGWNENLKANWEECVREVGIGTARVWGLYIAGSRLGFERGEIELHHVLATKDLDGLPAPFPLQPDWMD